MPYMVVIEGQNIPVPDEIGANDDAVKRALTPFYPEVANAMITRTEANGLTTITVVKRAGSKGSGLDDLMACPGGKNPAIALYEEIEELRGGYVGPYELLSLDTRIEQALEVGQAQAEGIAYAGKRLNAAAPQPAPVLVWGF
jgi:hypothetical protein